jgi:hypothetical protein
LTFNWKSIKTIYKEGGIGGFWRGLVPWAWIEASTKGATLLFTATEVEFRAKNLGFSPSFSGVLGGCCGGVAQAYTTVNKFNPDGLLHFYENCRSHETQKWSFVKYLENCL